MRDRAGGKRYSVAYVRPEKSARVGETLSVGNGRPPDLRGRKQYWILMHPVFIEHLSTLDKHSEKAERTGWWTDLQVIPQVKRELAAIQ